MTAAVLVMATLWPAQSAAQSSQPVRVNAEGNVTQATGPLRFNPASVSVPVGGWVEWVNTDCCVPHTATEDNGLWNETGTYGQTPFNPAGFGPGETRMRRFAAGTWSYFCEVHPQQMHGVVSVPDRVTLLKVRRKHRRRHGRAASTRKRPRRFQLVAVWATEPLPPGQVFDVQVRRGSGEWTTALAGTRSLQGTLARGPARTTWSVRSRVRSADEPARASGYSPPATITAG